MVVVDAVAKEVANLRVVVVAAHAERQAGVFVQFGLEDVGHVVVELVAERLGVHRHDGARRRGGSGLAVSAQEGKIGNGHGIVVFEGVCVETDEVICAGVERKIRLAIHGTEHIAASPEAVVVADEADIRRPETVQLVAHPLELARQAEVGLVAAVYDEVHTVAVVYGRDGGPRLVVPPLRVADDGKTDGVLPGTGCLDLLDVAAVDVALAVEARVVGVILDDVAPGGQPHDCGCGGEDCPRRNSRHDKSFYVCKSRFFQRVRKGRFYANFVQLRRGQAGGNMYFCAR